MSYTPVEVQSGNAVNNVSVNTLIISDVVIPDNPGQLLIVGTSTRGTTAVDDIWLGVGQELTKLQHNNTSGNEARAELWYLKDPAPGTFDLIANWAGQTYCIFGYTLFKFVDQETTFSNTILRDHSGLTVASDLSSAAGELGICCATMWNNGYNDTPGNTDAYLYRRIWNTASAGSNRTWAISSGEDGAATVTFNWTSLSAAARWAFINTSLLPMENMPPKKMRYHRRRERIPDYISTLDGI